MARGRMLNRSISHSKQVAELVASVGFAGGMVWTWMIAHLDREGRIHGDPDVLKGIVCPRIAGITPEVIRQTAAKAAELGLIVWYESQGDKYIEFPKFADNQPNMRADREPESLYPSPTSEGCRKVAGTLPADCRQVDGNCPLEEKGSRREVEEKGSEEKISVELRLDRADCGEVTPCGSEDVKKVFAHYRRHHPKSHTSPVSTSKEWRAIKARLAEGCTVERLCQAIDGMHLTPHNMGENDRNQQYLGLELCMRSGSQVERFAETAERHANGPPPVLSTREAKGVRAMQSWLARKEAENEARGPAEVYESAASAGGDVSR